MNTYKFTEPFFLTSKHKTTVYKADESKVGYIQKMYDNDVQRYVSLFLDKLYFQYNFYNPEGERISFIKNIKENKKDYIRSRWLYKKENDNVIITNKTKLKTNIRFQIDMEEHSPIEVTRDFAENKVVFWKGNKQLAVINHTKTLPRKITVHTYNEDVLPLDLIFFIYFVYRIYSI
ncbi:tubby C-terminal domain-like protein [Alteribacillus bidgolensis]|uniref:Tubby C-terminal domain-containing protein n=1 Tax=Alteribacillus bidgolensis TaxID=930129 RepID=A0A1G8S1Y7_9BACI|nr:hypothetical protein [Alteribacillus bidgolensis]SDJ23132.1 hypothetical protein SAMN05216352_1394 [Alteribacillus bidgolensis]